MTKMVKAKLNGKYEIVLPEHRAARPEWYQPGGWEKARLDSMHKTTKKGDIVYYVGAEEGEMCALLQMWGARVAMFEPNHLVWPNIKAIWDANKLADPYFVFPGFAGNENSKIAPDYDPGLVWPPSADGPIISNHGFKNLCEADGTTPIIKIDSVVELSGGAPDMITMDVEGAEIQVLWGAEQTLRKYHPRIYLSLHPEFLWQNYHEYSHDLREWIKAIGYKETLLDYQHEVHLLYEAIK